MRRLVPALAAAAVLALSLSACAPSTTSAVGTAGCGSFPSGDSSDTVRAEGEVGEAPEVEFPTPLLTKGDQVTQLIQGSGPKIAAGDTADIGVSLLLGESGELGQAIGYEPDNKLLRTVDDENSLNESLICANVGSRYALTTTAASAFGPGALADSGIEDDATLVIVVDVLDRFLGRADGTNQLQTPGLPSVVTAVDGQPGIVLPGNTAPTEPETAVVKAGGGDLVEEGDRVVLHSTAWAWTDEDASAGESNWDGSPVIIPAGEETVEGAPFAPQLVGERVGTQLIRVLPGDDQGGAAQVYVIDILGVVSDD